jgi:hypothetical protein
VRDARGFGVLARSAHQLAVELDAQAARAVLARGSDHDPSVARAEVDHEIVGTCARHLEHALDHLGGRGDERRPPLVLVRLRGRERPDQNHGEEELHFTSFKICSRTSGFDQSSSPMWR